jgi:hypothetical protein
MTQWLVVLLVMAPVVVCLAVSRNQSRRSVLRAQTVDLRLDEFGARRELADGRCEEVDWTEVREVEVVTARSGPHAASGGVVVLAGDEARGCLVPLDRIEACGLLEHLQRLPGFSVDRFVDALGERAPSRVTVWQEPISDSRAPGEQGDQE